MNSCTFFILYSVSGSRPYSDLDGLTSDEWPVLVQYPKYMGSLGALNSARRGLRIRSQCQTVSLFTHSVSMHCGGPPDTERAGTDSGKWTDLNYSALHDGERLEQWLSSGKSNAVSSAAMSHAAA
jgi:hypothetical protein